MLDRLFHAFPALRDLDAEARAILSGGLRDVHLPPRTTLFSDGDACHAFLLVLDGSVRVQKVGENGREIVLYRVEPGQTCVLTTACLMTHTVYGADGITETEVHGLTLTPAAFGALVARSAVFRDFVFSAYATRISDLLMLIEEVAFRRIDLRMAQMLLARAQDGTVTATHHDLAAELGTAREVVSRQLKEFERRGWVALHRGRVELRAPTALQTLAATR